MEILIISVAFPPRNSPGAIRPYSWAKYWGRAGHKVTVLTTKKGASDGDLKCNFQDQLENPFSVVEIDYKFWRPSPPKAVISSNYTQDLVEDNHHNLKYIQRWIRHQLGPLVDPYYVFIPAALRAGRRLCQTKNYDIIISTFSPITSHLIALQLKKTQAIPWVADFRDLWSGQAYYRDSWTAKVSQFLEKKALFHADMVMTVSEPIREWFAQRFEIPCFTVENGFDEEEMASLTTEKIFPEDGKLRFVYTGSIYAGRDPTPFFAAMHNLISSGQLARDRVELVFYGRHMEKVIHLAQAHSLEDIVKTPGLVDRPTALRAQRDADGLIFLQWEYNDPGRTDGMLTAKVFEYFRAGKPILGIGISPNSSAGQLMLQAGVGFPLGTDVGHVQEFILNNFIIRKNPIINPNLDMINKYSRETLAYRALAHLEKLVHS